MLNTVMTRIQAISDNRREQEHKENINTILMLMERYNITVEDITNAKDNSEPSAKDLIQKARNSKSTRVKPTVVSVESKGWSYGKK